MKLSRFMIALGFMVGAYAILYAKYGDWAKSTLHSFGDAEGGQTTITNGIALMICMGFVALYVQFSKAK